MKKLYQKFQKTIDPQRLMSRVRKLNALEHGQTFCD